MRWNDKFSYAFAVFFMLTSAVRLGHKFAKAAADLSAVKQTLDPLKLTSVLNTLDPIMFLDLAWLLIMICVGITVCVETTVRNGWVASTGNRRFFPDQIYVIAPAFGVILAFAAGYFVPIMYEITLEITLVTIILALLGFFAFAIPALITTLKDPAS